MAEYYSCSKCGKNYRISIALSDYGKTVTMISCRSCGLTICGNCGNWDQIKYSKCPNCRASALWEQNSAIPC